MAGCGTQSMESFLLETPECSLFNNFQVDGTATPWNDCRVYWSGSPDDVLTVELTTPGTMGSFLAPAPSWVRASVTVDGGTGTTKRTAVPFSPTNVLPTALDADEIALTMPIAGCADLTATMPMVDVMTDIGDRSVSFSMSLEGTCDQTTFTGGFIVSAAGRQGMVGGGDPAATVSVP